MRSAPAGSVDVELEVPFHDVDALNVVWHGHYYKYVEIGRTALLRTKDIDFGRTELGGHRAYVVETKCRHVSPLHYGDKFRVRAWLESCDVRVDIGFEIFNLTHQRRSAVGHTLLAIVDAQGTLLLEVPDEIRRRLL
jgi:acyl-CoA thioester hydrolase